MSERILITFSGSRYHDTTKKIVEDGPRFGASKVLVYDDIWLKEKRPDFCKNHAALFSKKCAKTGSIRGVCWFLWKPMIILDALNRCEHGDIVCFTDADCWPVSDMAPLFEMCERDSITLFAACSHLQRHWSKRDTQLLMDCDSDEFRDKQAGVARFMLFKKMRNGTPINGAHENVAVFLDRWFSYTADERLNTFDVSTIKEEYSDLKEPRCEQAILTNMAHRLGIPLHREADQWGNNFKADFPNDTYGQIFESTGVYSHDPKPLPGQKGSRFRNVND